jgi:hypothetical protein
MVEDAVRQLIINGNVVTFLGIESSGQRFNDCSNALAHSQK